MEQKAAIALIQELTTRLSALAEEFGGHAGPATPMADAATSVSGDREDRRTVAVRLLEERRTRLDFLPGELFHEPAWDMLLALYLAHLDRRTMNVKTLVSYAEAPVTTSQRWIDHLAKLKLVDRVIDPMDRRRVDVSLSDTGVDAIDRYLDNAARL